jgi:hypothetical protein
VGFFRFLLIWQVLVDINLPMDSPRGVPTIPKVLLMFVERFGRSRFGFGGVDLRVLFIPSCPGYIVLTGALDSSIFGPWCSCSVLGLFGVVLLGFV